MKGHLVELALALARRRVDEAVTMAAGSGSGRRGNSAVGKGRVGMALAGLSPAAFGLVMATGIVAVAALQAGWPRLANVLFILNIGQYGLLWLLYLGRIWWFAPRVWADLTSHAVGPGYFTVVAATGILASQFVLQGGFIPMGRALWALTAILWLLLTYGIFAALMVKRVKPSLRRGINGSWLLAVVATQAVAVTAALLAASGGNLGASGWEAPALNLIALLLWLWGGMLYIWLMTLIFYRHLFFAMPPDELSPPFWISMGAMAISALAGTQLVTNAGHDLLLAELLPFLKGLTLFYWVAGSWWIPLLLLLGLWRHGVARYPLRYDPLYWGMVFPLGMYAVCTRRLAQMIGVPFLDNVVMVFFVGAVLAWTIAYAAMLHNLWLGWRREQVT